MTEQFGPTTPPSLVEQVYERFRERDALARERMGRALTFTEKVLFAHADDARDLTDRRPGKTLRGESVERSVKER